MAADKLISKLNQRMAEKVAGKSLPMPQNQPSQFAQILDQKRGGGVDRLSETFMDKGPLNQIQVLPAEDIQINIANSAEVPETSTSGGRDLSELFSTINSDMLSLDSAIDVLASNDVKLSRSQLLAYQAGIGSITITTDLFSKLAQSLSQNLNTLLQTNLG